MGTKKTSERPREFSLALIEFKGYPKVVGVLTDPGLIATARAVIAARHALIADQAARLRTSPGNLRLVDAPPQPSKGETGRGKP